MKSKLPSPLTLHSTSCDVEQLFLPCFSGCSSALVKYLSSIMYVHVPRCCFSGVRSNPDVSLYFKSIQTAASHGCATSARLGLILFLTFWQCERIFRHLVIKMFPLWSFEPAAFKLPAACDMASLWCHRLVLSASGGSHVSANQLGVSRAFKLLFKLLLRPYELQLRGPVFPKFRFNFKVLKMAAIQRIKTSYKLHFEQK